MNQSQTPSHQQSKLVFPLLWVLAGLSCFVGCGDVPAQDDDYFRPAGVIRGSVTYNGPLPCTKQGHIVGSAVILSFDERFLPPPDGLGSSARTLALIPGDVLFSGVTTSIPANADGSLACPPPGTNITVSADWELGPYPAGRYQVRGYYDYDGDFSPSLGIHSLPTGGDVLGGVVENVSDLLRDPKTKPVYRTIEVGDRDKNGNLFMPKTGKLIEGVSMTLGIPAVFGRPIAHFAGVLDERPLVPAEKRFPNTREAAENIVIPQDYRFSVSPTLNPGSADKEFLRVLFKPGVPDEEVSNALDRSLSLQVVSPWNKLFIFPQVDAAGNIVPTPEKTAAAVADLFPQVVFARADPRDPTGKTTIRNPASTLSGLVVNNSIIGTLAGNFASDLAPKSVDMLQVYLRPTIACIDVTDSNFPVTFVATTFKAENGQEVVDVNDLRPKLAKRFGRPESNIRIVVGCLPAGGYRTNLVYNTGQAWSMPNEAGSCVDPLEQPLNDSSGNPTLCKYSVNPARPTLPSQNKVLTIGAPLTEGYCNNEALAALNQAQGGDPMQASDYVDGVPRTCLNSFELVGKLSANPSTLPTMGYPVVGS
jgi:hypothetical protein